LNIDLYKQIWLNVIAGVNVAAIAVMSLGWTDINSCLEQDFYLVTSTRTAHVLWKDKEAKA